MSALVESRYNIAVPLRNGAGLVHNTMSGATAVLDREEMTELAHVRERTTPVAERLLHAGYLVPEGCDELAVARDEYARMRFDRRRMLMTIAPTLECNFGCDYCFQGADKPTGRMSEAVQKAILAFVAHHSAVRRIHVAWYGGEPLLAVRIVERLSDRLIAYCRAHEVGYDAMIVTNGFKLDGKTARSLTSRAVNMAQVTLDGAADYHDRRRATLRGKGTFERILDNLNDVVENSSLRLSVRVNIDMRNAAGIEGALRLLAKRGFSRRRRFEVYFAPVEAVTEGCHAISDSCMTKGDYSTLETGLYALAYKLGLSSLPYPRQFRSLCTAVRPTGYVITPTGDVHKCWDTVSFAQLRVGSVFDPGALDQSPAVRPWLDWNPFENETCSGCKLLPSCSGSCAHKFVNSEQTLGEAASLPCPSWKYQIKERLLALALNAGTIRKEDVDPAAAVTDPKEICPTDELGALAQHVRADVSGFVPVARLKSKTATRSAVGS